MADMSAPFDYHLTRYIFRYYGSDSVSVVEAGNDLCTALATFGVDSSHGWERIHWNVLQSLTELVSIYMQALSVYERGQVSLAP
jgi:putative aminopeptidase FrvX